MSESEDQGITTVSQKGFESPTPSRLNIIRIRGRLIDYEQRMLKLRGRSAVYQLRQHERKKGNGENMLHVVVSWS